MILKECRDWVDAFGDCFRGASTGKVKRALSALDKNASGRWEVGLRGDLRFKQVSFRYFGAGDDHADFQKRAAAVFEGLPRARRRPDGGLPWLSFSWDQDEPGFPLCYSGGEARAPGGAKISFRADPWSSKVLSDASLKAVFEDIAALCPIKELVSQSGRAHWSLRFLRGVSWPEFARLTLAAPFTDDATMMAYLLLDRKVTEIEFEDAALRVYFGA